MDMLQEEVWGWGGAREEGSSFQREWLPFTWESSNDKTLYPPINSLYMLFLSEKLAKDEVYM
jgi:hypothetical protein